MARIVTVYSGSHRPIRLVDMSNIRWWKISSALARLGHQVDIATNEWHWFLNKTPKVLAPGLRKVSLRHVRWRDYDVVKTLFHLGFETLVKHGGSNHPFIISKLGSVVGSEDLPGIFFHGANRERMYETQRAIARTSRYVTLLSEAAIALWRESFGPRDNLLLLPGAVDAEIPPPGPDPYPRSDMPRCIFSGNIYFRGTQPEANAVIVAKLNDLGRKLIERGVRLYLLGTGEVRDLDRSVVTYLGSCDYARSWDYLHHAQVGIVVTGGGKMHNNESTKIYHYLRAGLPAVVEAGFPNDHLVTESGLGFLVPNQDMTELADKVRVALSSRWDRERGVNYILRNHTWDARAAVYDQLIRQYAPDRQAVSS